MITIQNVMQTATSQIPKKYSNDLSLIKEAVSTRLYSLDQEVKNIIDQVLNEINAELQAATKPAPKPAIKKAVKLPIPAKKTTKKAPQHKPKKVPLNLVMMPIFEIKTDEKRFQNRSKLNQTVLQNIVENYSDTKLDPVIVWIDPKDEQTYLLAGHHRLEATKRVGRKSIITKFFEGSEAQAIKYAKVESNANRSLEFPHERAKVYREMRISGDTKKAIENEAAKLEGKNANYILNLSYLEPNGIVIQAVDSLSGTADKQNATLIEKIADWIGEARRKNDLTAAHEKEMFSFLQDAESSKRLKTKADFLQKITAITGGFDYDKTEPLNLKKLKYKSEGETAYESEMNDLKSKLDNLIQSRIDLKDRVSNPLNERYINPSSPDYSQTMKAFDDAFAKTSNEIKVYQQKIIELQRKKGQYTTAGNNQIGLFGAKKTTKTRNTISSNKPKSNRQSIAIRKLNAPAGPAEYFQIDDIHISNWLGNIEKKNKESVVITLTGEQGSMKTRLAFRLMNAFAQKYNVGHASIEEHPESVLYMDKVEEYLNQTAQNNIENPEIKGLDDLHRLIENNDVIVIDSFQKLRELDKSIEVDKDLRKKYNGKLFIVIFQQTSDGKMRGGSTSQFDADIVAFTEKMPSYADNYGYFDKNRYQRKDLSNLHYNIFTGTIKTQETEQEAPGEVPPVEEPINFSFNVN